MARSFTSSLVVELLDRVTGPANKVGASLSRLGQGLADASNPRTRLDAAMARNDAALSRTRGSLIDAAAGAWVIKSAFGGTLSSAMSLEDKMADIGKVSDMNAQQLKAFEGSLRTLARTEIPLAVEELAELAAAAAASGIDDSDLQDFTRQVAKSAVAWGVSGDYAGEALAKIKSALGMNIDETARYADAINYLSDTSASEAPDLIEFARRVAADGAIAGFTNEQVLALGSSMIAMGAQSDVAATSLRNAQKALTRGASATKRQDAAFRKLGLHADDVAKAMPNDAMGQFLLVMDRIRQLDQHEQISTMTDLFGDEARALMPLLGQLDQVRQTTAAVADETNYLGSVQKEFEVRSQTGRYALQKFNNQLRDVSISIGSSLLPAMKQLLETISPVLLAIADWAQQNPKLVASIAALVGGLVALRVAMIGIRFVSLMAVGGLLRLTAGVMALSRGAALAGAAWRLGVLGAIGRSVMLGKQVTMLGKLAGGLRGLLFAIPGVARIAAGMNRVSRATAGVVAKTGEIGPAMARAATATETAAGRMSRALNRIKWSSVGAGIGMLALAPAIAGQTAQTEADWVGSGALKPRKEKESWGDWLWPSYRLGGDQPPVDGARKKGGPISRGSTYLTGEDGPEVITARRSGYVHPNGAAGGGAQISVNAPITIHAQPGEDVETLARRLKRIFENEMGASLRSALSDFQME